MRIRGGSDSFAKKSPALLGRDPLKGSVQIPGAAENDSSKNYHLKSYPYRVRPMRNAQAGSPLISNEMYAQNEQVVKEMAPRRQNGPRPLKSACRTLTSTFRENGSCTTEPK
jgi:hypothetical protein